MDAEPSSKPSTPMAKLKLAGAFSGCLDVDTDNWTVPTLREEVAKRLDCEPISLNLICGGKVLKDGDQKLRELGIKNNSKILVTKFAATDRGDSLKNELVAEEEQARLLDRIKSAAAALADRHADGSLPLEDFNIELENQNGQKVHFGSDIERQGAMMGLMFHTKAKNFIRKMMYKEALDILTMGEEAFSLCDKKFLEIIDNVPILQIDMVWCYFMLRDIKWLSLAGLRLAKAREGIERCYGKDLSRARILQGGCHPELALFMRLELLEGVVAYHSGQFDKSWTALSSAQAKFLQLQVSDEALSLIMGMGYKQEAAKRALRMNKQDVEHAVEFLVQENEKKAQRRKDNIQRQEEIMEQKLYGTTPLKKAVNLQSLNELVSIGFEKTLAAEALRRNENDTQKALDDLTNPETNSKIQLYIDSRNAKRLRQTKDAAIEELTSMGFDRSRGFATLYTDCFCYGEENMTFFFFDVQVVVAAVRATGTQERALDLLTAQPGDNQIVPGQNPSNSDSLNSHGSVASADPVQDLNSVGAPGNGEHEMVGPSDINKMDARDVEMEDGIAQDITGDVFSDYDIEVTKEGEAITEYLALLASARDK